jgi:hypothetical protein
MSTVIIRTNAGKKHDHDVRMGNADPSSIKYIVGYQHEPITDVLAIKDLQKSDLTKEVLRRPDFARINLDDFSSSFKLILDETVEVLIKAVAIELENGITWGYAPYFLERGGLDKSTDFIYELDLVTSEVDSDTLSIKHELFDLREMRERMLESITAKDLLPVLQTELIRNYVKTITDDFLCHGIKAPALGENLCTKAKNDTSISLNLKQLIHYELEQSLCHGIATSKLGDGIEKCKQESVL